ncbi:hypothetical protein [Acinetobacter calcoaceticus]|uniref:hypothetical protein n=1 Tax=Acinetobacter calcoaceticus TaxID=471 RepID=UPI001E40936F|nr:hypothetical protein [Acinetobacter calcoaceticus]UGQ29802.1 hypothetical protein LRO84_18275 [Acinetobacter calcoaceticus]
MSRNIFLFLAVFVISLDSYFRLRGIFGLGFLFLYLLTIKFNTSLDRKYILPIGLMAAGFGLYTLLAFFYPNTYLQINEDKELFYFKIFDRFSLILLFIFICFSFKNKNYAEILRNIALVHIFYLTFQFVMYYGLHIEIDILSWFGIEQRTDMVYDGLNIFRPAGFFWEPSNFAAYILALYLPYLIKQTNYHKLDYLLPISIVLTLSSAAFLIGTLVMLVMLWKTGLIKKPKVLLFAILVGIPIILFGYQSQKARFEDGLGDNANTLLRLNLVEYAFKSRLNSPLLLVGGTGIYSYDLYIKNEEDSPFGRSIASIQDATFFVFTYLLTGIIGLIILFLLIMNVKGISNKFFVLIFMLTKISFLFPVFLFFIYTVFENKRKRIETD